MGSIFKRLTVAGAAVLGFLIGVKAWPNNSRQLLRDLPVIENFERYRYADSIDFLRQLEASKLFDEEASDGK